MRVRFDSVFVSSVLYTIGLLCLVRAALWTYYGSTNALLVADDQTMHYLGVACLAIILIGLIVIWTGYVRRARSAWLVMFVVVWFWVLPLFAYRFLEAVIHGRLQLSFPEFLYDAISPGDFRPWVEAVLIFLLMVVALVLPIRKLFFGKGCSRTSSPAIRQGCRLFADWRSGWHECAICLG